MTEVAPSLAHAEIAARFNARFARACNTVLIGGAPEPIYLPGTGQRPAIIRYTLDYAQSALHEIAHWCLAGEARRGLVDYGMWYQPPPRSPRDQARFFAAEVPVQALEMLLAEASGVPFRFSTDNPGNDDPAAEAAFASQVRCARDALRALGPDGLALAALQALGAGRGSAW